MPDLVQQRIQNVLSLRTLSAGPKVSASAEQAGTLAARVKLLEDAISVNANGSIAIRMGSAAVVLKKDGSVTISGRDISIDAFGKAMVKAGGEVVIKGAKISQN